MVYRSSPIDGLLLSPLLLILTLSCSGNLLDEYFDQHLVLVMTRENGGLFVSMESHRCSALTVRFTFDGQ